jgi:hypothetical protein
MTGSDGKKILKIGSLAVFFAFIIIYAFSRSSNLMFGVEIKNVNIIHGSKVADPILRVTGNANNAINLTLNGREISIDQNGDFSETIALLPGYNIINLRAQDKFENKDEKNYQLIYQAPQ